MVKSAENLPMKRALFASLTFHVLLAVVVWQMPGFHRDFSDKQPPDAMRTRTVSQAELDKLLKKPKQVVLSEDSIKTKKFKLNPNEKLFYAKQNQFVEKNTKAAAFGDHKNIIKEGLPPVSELFKVPAANTVMKIPSPKEDPVKKGRTHNFKKARSPASIGNGISTTDEYLPDVAIGSATLLNTQEYVFASFYERIRGKLKHQWQTLLRQEMESLQRQGAPMFQGERITKLKIFMNPEGKVTKIQKLGTAGYQELDRAAVDAFKVASPFPNPPKAMVEKENGLLSIEWHFVVMGSPQNGLRVDIERYPGG